MLLLATALATAAAVGPRTQTFIYWSSSTGTIGRANLNGKGVNQSFIRGAGGGCGLAVDGAHIYWANEGTMIGRASLNGKGVNQSFIKGAEGPCKVAVSSGHGRP